MHKNSNIDVLKSFLTGPGGIDCSCCTKGTKKEHKVYSNKVKRRKMKIDLRKEIMIYDDF